ncbi:MAG TPA: hypothetical protein VKB86_22275 [Pyrinomonadaceae bacterium]|nr:hypothetical protein [Pyrinomonadaceae bacterium]
MLVRHILSPLIIVMCAITVAGQEKSKVTVNSNGEIVVPPQFEEYVRRRTELLKNPDFLKLTLDPVVPKQSKEGNEEKPFEVGKKISFTLLLTNTLSEPFIIEAGSSYDNTRPLLIKDGVTVPYHKNATKSVENKRQIINRVNGLSISLQPNKTESIGTIDLKDWYEELEPGRYLLTLQYRVRGSEKWIESSPIMFEVASKESQ